MRGATVYNNAIQRKPLWVLKSPGQMNGEKSEINGRAWCEAEWYKRVAATPTNTRNRYAS